MKKTSVLLIFCLTFVFLFAPLNSVSGETVIQHEVTPMFIGLVTQISDLSIEDNVATARAMASCSSNYSVRVTAYLQRYVNGGWSTVNSWTGSKGYISSVNKEATVSSGYVYRVRSVATVYDSDDKIVETVGLISQIVSN